jgi:hypothetical protein
MGPTRHFGPLSTCPSGRPRPAAWRSDRTSTWPYELGEITAAAVGEIGKRLFTSMLAAYVYGGFWVLV